MSKELEEGQKLELDWNKLEKAVAGTKGIIPVAVQNADTKEVILVAYINHASLAHTPFDVMKFGLRLYYPAVNLNEILRLKQHGIISKL